MLIHEQAKARQLALAAGLRADGTAVPGTAAGARPMTRGGGALRPTTALARAASAAADSAPVTSQYVLPRGGVVFVMSAVNTNFFQAGAQYNLSVRPSTHPALCFVVV